MLLKLAKSSCTFYSVSLFSTTCLSCWKVCWVSFASTCLIRTTNQQGPNTCLPTELLSGEELNATFPTELSTIGPVYHVAARVYGRSLVHEAPSEPGMICGRVYKQMMETLGGLTVKTPKVERNVQPAKLEQRKNIGTTALWARWSQDDFVMRLFR